ncbi:MAG: SDR family oxidoreductase [Burkholderiales bacterium]|nr:SDR family oxidoreductase [Burkholderiales bacterium]
MEDKLFSVKGQVVLAVGATRGIGKALAGGFSERGATVIIAGRDQAVLDQTRQEISHDIPVEAHNCDVAKAEDVTKLVDAVMAKHGRIDTLLNVAGVNTRKRVETYTPEEYDRILDINLRGHFLVAQAVGRQMLARRSGSIINIDSLNTYAPLTGVTPYAMSKGGVTMMTRGMALEWGPRGVRVNAIAPGFFPTDLSKKLWAEPKMQAWGKTVTPLERLGDVKELVGTAIFLASEASAFMTGQVLRVDGGISAGINWPIELG